MANGVVSGSPDTSLLNAGVPAKIVEQMHSAFDFDRDVVSQLQRGDAFRLIYETKFAEGSFVRHGRLQAMQHDHDGKTTELFRFDNDNAGGNFYDAEGNISRRTFMRVPLDVQSVTSEFSPMRRHPVTGVLRPHLGTDFRAPWGAVVRAAADGTVEFAGVGTCYGNYIRIAHGPGILTLYAHLSSIDPHVKKGTKVKYGEVIGRVGQTGLATGPHLHYELMIDGVQITPRTADLPATENLSPYPLAQLRAQTADIQARFEEAAEREGKPSPGRMLAGQMKREAEEDAEQARNALERASADNALEAQPTGGAVRNVSIEKDAARGRARQLETARGN